MSESTKFNPDWASSPGETIADILKDRRCSLGDFAHSMGVTQAEARDLLQGRTPISLATAKELEATLGIGADFWIARERQFREDCRRAQQASTAWLRELPLRDMRAFGWLDQGLFSRSPLEACLGFFAVPSVGAWTTKYQNVLQSTAFRTSAAFKASAAATAAWVRQGEIQGTATKCDGWNPSKFKAMLSEIRGLTRRRNPELFLGELRKRCAETGVAVAVVRAPNGCRASGATKFIDSSRALILLSFRYLSDDHFWFTFFHEAGHLLLHGKDKVFIEGANISSEAEKEANDFAEQVLVPTEFRQDLRTVLLERHSIRKLAKQVGVSPGIIVGQLQHKGRLRPHELNNLKVRYTWGTGS